MDHSIFHTVSVKKSSVSIFQIEKSFSSISISGSKPWESLVFVLKAFKKYWTVSYFLNLSDIM